MNVFRFENGRLETTEVGWSNNGPLAGFLPSIGYEAFPSIILGSEKDSFSVQVYEDEHEGREFFVDVETNFCCYFVLVPNFPELIDFLSRRLGVAQHAAASRPRAVTA